MKKIMFIVLAISLLVPANSYSQSSALDAKKGFKDFTLGDAYSKWSSSLNYTNTEDDNIKYYDYIKQSAVQVFEYNVAKIRLGFKDEKLQVIYLVTDISRVSGNDMLSQYNSLKSSLSSLYGKPYEYTPDHNKQNFTSAWSGQKVILSLEFVYDGVKNDGGNIYTGTHCNILVGFITNKSGF
jgi:hypothetical protein